MATRGYRKAGAVVLVILQKSFQVTALIDFQLSLLQQTIMVACMLFKAKVDRKFIIYFLLTSFFYIVTQAANLGDLCDPTPIYR